MRWPWSKPKTETRSTGGYSALMTLARAETITGARGVAELTAAVQTCVSLWEGALSLADVEGTELLPPRVLALAARSLALRGEFVALVEGDRLTPAADWDVSTILSRPRAYRLSLPDVGGGRTVTALSAEVVHVVTGASVREPWRGTSPLQRASLTADLLATVEAALLDVYGTAPLGSSIVPMPEMAAEDNARLAASFRGQRGRVLLRESVSTTAAGGPQPMTDWRPQGLSPDIEKSEILGAYDRALAGICQAFGVDPSLLSPTSNGGGLREAQRALALWTLQPIAVLIGAELGDKLGTPVSLDVVRPLQAYDAGGRARAFSAMVRAMAEAKAAGLADGEVSALLRLVDWQGTQG
jgi:phage portal protein BeeE